MRSAIIAILIPAAAFLTQQQGFAPKSQRNRPLTPPPADTTPVFSAETREVPLNVTVTDHNGHFVTTHPSATARPTFRDLPKATSCSPSKSSAAKTSRCPL